MVITLILLTKEHAIFFTYWSYFIPPNESIRWPRYSASPVDALYSRLDEPSEMKGSPQVFQMRICRCVVLKRALEILGDRQTKKQGDFVITKSQNQVAQREKSSDFS